MGYPTYEQKEPLRRPGRFPIWPTVSDRGRGPPARSNEGTAYRVTAMTGIPKIIHQTWQDTEVPWAWRGFQASWRRHHPDWSYRLWTDDDNRRLIHNHYPWFASTYDGYDEPIMRADAARYFILHRHGGLYADLDFECLRSLEPLLAPHRLVLGTEPPAHLTVDVIREHALTHIVCNALMASVPGHRFWEDLFEKLIQARDRIGPLDTTGPFFLTRAYDAAPAKGDIALLDAELLYPVSSTECWQGRLREPAYRRRVAERAYAIHHWSGSWWRREEVGEAPIVHRDWQSFLLRHGRIESAKTFDGGDPAPGTVEPPRISCLMVTKQRLALAKRSIACFRNQTYANRELVIVDDDPDDGLAQVVAELGDDRIKHLRLAPEGRPLGELRNLSVAHATGAYVSQWDDDDLHDPLRLEIQMDALRSFQADACIMLQQLLWWPGRRRMAVSRPRLWESSILCAKEKLIDYPAQRRGEDTPVVAHVARHGRVALLDRPDLYVYSCHHQNTFDDEHFEQHWRSASERFEGLKYDAMIQAIGQRMPVH